MKKPILSICIATYNRADYIGETLESIIPQLADDVEVLVVDGASTDNTEEIVSQYAKNESRIRYVRLPAKGGVDQDYDKSVNLAHGEYCWLFTDDDTLKPGAVEAVKKSIKEGHGLIIVNAEVRNRDLTAAIEGKRMIINDDIVYAPNDMENIFVGIMSHISFIGAVVIRRSIWLSRDRNSYYGTEFVHVGVIFQKPITASVITIAEPYIIIRFGNALWTTRSFDVWMFKWPKLVWSFKNISDKSKSYIINEKPWLSFKTLIYQKSLGSYDILLYKKYFSKMRINVLWKFCAWLIACFPRKIIIGFHYCYSRVKNPEYKTFFENHFMKSVK